MESHGSTPGITVGMKQTLRMLEKNKLKAVYAANDADRYVTRPVIEAAEAMGVDVIYVRSKKNMCSRFGIERGAAVAGIIAEDI